MSAFGTNGFDKYPNIHLDREAAHAVTEWTDDRLNSFIEMYRWFAKQEDILPHHVEQASQIQGWAEFEADCRDGLYEIIPDDVSSIEDEACAGS